MFDEGGRLDFFLALYHVRNGSEEIMESLIFQERGKQTSRK